MTSYKNSDKLIGLFTRVSYNFNDRYLLMASLRHEGSSKFGKDHKWGNFPGISLGWRINRENFMKNVNWMDNLKLRVGMAALGGWALVLAALAVLWRYHAVSRKQFGGITGDLAGWFLQKAELWMLAALCACQWGGLL